MVMTDTIAWVEEEAARRVTDLDASDHAQGTLTAAWHESREPLTAVESTTGLSHLAFTASVENSPVNDDGSGETGTFLTLSLDLVVIFVYRIPANGGVAATRMASKAALQVVKALMAGWPEAVVFCKQAYKPGPINNGWMPVETRFAVQIDTPV